MDFYKKNPKIKDSIVVQGKNFDDDTVVSGEKFRMFADPKTFPGVPPKLVKVDPSVMSESQVDQAEESLREEDEKPPRHIGITTSESLGSPKVGAVKISTMPRSAVPVEEKKVKVPEKKKRVVVERQPKKLFEMYSVQTFADVFPGITEKNSKAILASEMTLGELSKSSNSRLRKMGVTPSFFSRLRKKAEVLSVEEMKEG